MIKFMVLNLFILSVGTGSSAETERLNDLIDSNTVEEHYRGESSNSPCSINIPGTNCDVVDIDNDNKDRETWSSPNSPGRRRRAVRNAGRSYREEPSNRPCSINIPGTNCDVVDIDNDNKDRETWSSPNSPGRRRRAVGNAGGHSTIVYILDDLFNDWDRLAIRSAMDQIERDTCVRFLEKTDNTRFVDYVSIQTDKWCWSHLMRNGDQGCKPSTELPNRMSRGLILHELLHTLGLAHEHQRPDRNQYITINWDNIKKGFEDKFKKDSSKFSGSSNIYDYKSVIHYTWNKYAKDKSVPVLTPKNCNLEKEDLGLGLQRGDLTQLDIQKINKLFNCP